MFLSTRLMMMMMMMMMMTRRVTLRTVRDRSFAISCVISFVRDLDARDARDVDARRTFTRMDGWLGIGAADDDDDDDDDDRALDEDGGDGENARTKD